MIMIPKTELHRTEGLPMHLKRICICTLKISNFKHKITSFEESRKFPAEVFNFGPFRVCGEQYSKIIQECEMQPR
jgi:hypothetical protein